MKHFSYIKRFFPQSFWWRSVLILVVPLISTLLITSIIFWENHWDKVSSRMARNVVNDIALVIHLYETAENEQQKNSILEVSRDKLFMSVSLLKLSEWPNEKQELSSLAARVLHKALQERISYPTYFDADFSENWLALYVVLDEQRIMRFSFRRNRVHSSSSYVVLIWMFGMTTILMFVALIFMKNQVRPLRKLAEEAELFRKGYGIDYFPIRGAKEVRQAGHALENMRRRIQRHIKQRTEILTAISHDLRTPLTRINLSLAMMESNEYTEEIKNDVKEMKQMIDDYLQFIRQEREEPEKIEPNSDLKALLEKETHKFQYSHKDITINFTAQEQIIFDFRPATLSRCLSNLISNACRYADTIEITLSYFQDSAVQIIIDDNGPGIPEEEREKVFMPFHRAESSRNQETGGTGLGLTISQDIIRLHGGNITLSDSPLGGLRVKITLPV